MTINLYTITDDARVLNKTLGTPTELTNCEMIYPTDIYTPSVRISAASFTPDMNYMYIADLGRYYYITDSVYENGGAVTLTGRVDALMSYASEISALNVNVIRQEHAGLSNIVDGEITLTPHKELEFLLCDKTPFNIRSTAAEYNYVLVVAGGEQGE